MARNDGRGPRAGAAGKSESRSPACPLTTVLCHVLRPQSFCSSLRPPQTDRRALYALLHLGLAVRKPSWLQEIADGLSRQVKKRSIAYMDHRSQQRVCVREDS